MSDSELRAQLSRALGGGYILDRELDSGSKSHVFVAHDLARDRDVVVKVLAAELTQDASPERFSRELHLMGTLQEPHTLPIVESGHTSSGLFYYVSPFVKALSLRGRLKEGPLGFDESVIALRAVAQAMAQAHRQGIVHRDLKPGKVLLLNRTAVVTDFGVARALELARTDDSSARLKLVNTVGTPGYLPPEHTSMMSEADHRADIYAWGVIAYELFFEGFPLPEQVPDDTGELPASEFAEVLQHKRYGVPRQLAELVLQCVATDPEHRPSSADEILAVLDRIPDSSTALAIESKSTARLIGASILFAAALFVAGATAVWRLQSPGSSDAPLLAVLSFDTEGAIADSSFSDGLADALTRKLGRLRGLRVIDRRSVIAVERTQHNVADAGKMLGADYVLHATIRWLRDADGVLSAQVSPALLNVDDGTTKWSGKPEIVFPADPFGVQSTLALATADEIGIRMSGDEQAQMAVRGTVDTAAFAAFTRGEQLFLRDASPSLATSQATIAAFTRAYQKDPRYAEALGSAALVFVRMANMSHNADLLDSAAHRAQRARSLAPNNPRALTAAAGIAQARGRPAVAEDLIGRALYENRSLVEALILRADLMLLSGDSASAWKDVERTTAVAPRSTDALLAMARIAIALRRFENARDFLSRARIADPARRDIVLSMARLDLADGDISGLHTALVEFRSRGGILSATDLDLLRAGDVSDQTALADGRLSDFGVITREDTLRFALEKGQLYLSRKNTARARALIDSAAETLDSLLFDRSIPIADRRRFEELRAWTDAARGHRTLELNAVTRADRSPIAEQWANGSSAAFSACNGAEIFAFLGDVEQMIAELRRCLTLPGGYTANRVLLQPALARYADDPRLRVMLDGLHVDFAKK